MDNLSQLKRCFGQGQDGDGDDDGGNRKRFKLASAVRDVMNELSLKEMVQRLEPFFRKLVREEVERATQSLLHASPGPSSSQIESSGVRKWQLHFVNKLPSTIFTGSKVEAEGSSPVKIVILDARSKDIITSGPLSSVKIEILVLDGDFGTDENEDWTENEFNTNIVREREGKRPLVTGNLIITLKCGVGYIGDILFTDNSSWIRSRKFRLGARIVSGISNEERIREARSEAFVVKDHRGALYQKHHPPSLDDEVWRLERIAKDGASHNRLADHRIHNVRDFLRLYITDQSSLRKMLGPGISNKIWEIIIEHANTYVGDEQLYAYYGAGERVAGLVLSSIYKIVGLTFDGYTYQTVDRLTMQQKVLMEDLKRQAYRNVDAISPFPTRPLPTIQTETYNNPCPPQPNFPVTHQDKSDSQTGFDQSPSSSYICDWDDENQVEVISVAPCPPTEASSPMLRSNFIMRDTYTGPSNGGIGWSSSGSLGPVMPNGHLAADDAFQFPTSTLFPLSPATWGEGNGFFFAENNEEESNILSYPNFGVSVSRKGKPRERWCKIRAALKWGISIRRDAAAKRKEKFFFCPSQFWNYY